MSFIDGYLGLLSAAGVGTATELVAPGYARQPISFNDPVNGVCVNTIAYAFGQRVTGAIGRAIYDAPTGGNLLLVMPHPTPIAPGRLRWDAGEAGHLRLFLTALQPYLRGASFTGRLAAASLIGATSDAFDIVNPVSTSTDPANPQPLINTAPLSSGVALSINRGVLQAASMVPAGVE